MRPFITQLMQNSAHYFLGFSSNPADGLSRTQRIKDKTFHKHTLPLHLQSNTFLQRLQVTFITWWLLKGAAALASCQRGRCVCVCVCGSEGGRKRLGANERGRERGVGGEQRRSERSCITAAAGVCVSVCVWGCVASSWFWSERPSNPSSDSWPGPQVGDAAVTMRRSRNWVSQDQ